MEAPTAIEKLRKEVVDQSISLSVTNLPHLET